MAGKMKNILWSGNKSNVAVNIVLLLALVTFLSCALHYIITNSRFAAASITADGTVAIAGVNFLSSEQTILAVLDKNCRFCKEDAPFYRRLAAATQSRNGRLVVAFPHSVEDGTDYLQAEGIPASEVIQIRLKSLDLQGTPTLLLLNRHGKIIAKWVGELSAPVEDYIISVIGRDESAITAEASPFLRIGNPKDPPLSDPTNLHNELLSNSVTLIDIDNREDYAARHIGGAVNIPEDELYTRAQNELTVDKPIVLFSRKLDAHKIRNAETALRAAGFTKTEWLKLTLEAAKSAEFDLVTSVARTSTNSASNEGR
jgi:rhodanese-related sulfurtransferase